MSYTLECRNTGTTLELLNGNAYTIGRSVDSDMLIEDQSFSRDQFRLIVEGGRCTIEPISSNNPMFLNGGRILEKTDVNEACEIVAGAVYFVLLPNRACGKTNPQCPTVLLERSSVTRPAAISEPIELTARRYVLGRCANTADILLNHPSISRQHAEIFRTDDNYSIRDLGTPNGTFIDGQPAKNAMVKLVPGCVIEIGPSSIRFDGVSLQPLSDSHVRVGLIAKHLSRNIPNGSDSGETKSLLNDISLCFLPGEFVAILGPSGSGKSTLLRALCNRENTRIRSAGTGEIYVNQKDLHRHFDRMKHLLAYIPQEDVLHDYLTINEALVFAAKLRLPPDTDQDELQQRVHRVLSTVSLNQHLRTKIGELSGGQKKRAILAAEVLAEPNLFFFDEVTSGLDENTDREIMNLMGRIAKEGKTVVCVTHNTSNVREYCSLVVVLGDGGALRFVGPPEAALGYFGVSSFSEIYDSVSEHGSDSESARRQERNFLKSEYWQKYVSNRIAGFSTVLSSSDSTHTNVRRPGVSSFFQQLLILIQRNLKLLWSDRNGLRSWFFQVVLIGFLLVWVFGDVGGSESHGNGRQASLGYFLVLSAFWFGCNNAARQIIREQVVFLHERDVGLGSFAY